jgi:hypothetical protein
MMLRVPFGGDSRSARAKADFEETWLGGFDSTNRTSTGETHTQNSSDEPADAIAKEPQGACDGLVLRVSNISTEEVLISNNIKHSFKLESTTPVGTVGTVAIDLMILGWRDGVAYRAAIMTVKSTPDVIKKRFSEGNGLAFTEFWLG